MSFELSQFDYLAEENPAQYLELMNALQQTYSRIELEEAFSKNINNYADYDVLFGTPQGHTFINTGTRIAGAYEGPLASSTETALELAQDAYDYEILSSQGDVIYRANMGAMKDASAAKPYQSASLLSLDLGVVGAACAPLFGVALGSELYQNNPVFWSQLSRKLLPFCYPGTTVIPGWLDIVESAVTPGTFISNLIIDKRIADAVGEFLEDFHEKIIPEYSDSGTYRLTSNLSFADMLSIIISMPPNGITITEEVITAMQNLVNQYPHSPFSLSVDMGTGSFQGRSALSLTVYKNYEIGDTIDLSGGTTTDSITTWGERASGGVLEVSSPQLNTGGYSSIYIGQKRVNAPGSNYFKICSANGYDIINYPDGTEEWGGDNASLSEYAKKIIYMEEDPNNPGSFIPVEGYGIQIAVPKKSTQPSSGVATKPDNWPEDMEWPTEIDFPWPAPEDYGSTWPETMPWPLPAEIPDWWPDGLAYPSNFSYPAPSVNPDENPDPNQNSDPADVAPFIQSSSPASSINPAEDEVPEPEYDPSKPNPVIAPVIPIDPPGNITPPDEGEGPTPIVPTIPLPFSSQNDGLISVYHPTDAQLKAFASWLWVTYADPSIDKLWNNPFDGVIGLMEIYCTPTDNGTKTIRSGFLDSGISSATISRYTEIDCGSIFVPEYYGNYLDYSPYSKAHVYLPFIGIVELNVDDVVGHGININYKIDEYNGSCIAQITCAKCTESYGDEVDYSAVTYQFSGNCAVELPLAGGTQSAIRAGMIQAAAYGLSSVIGGIVAGASGNIGGAISQTSYGVANAIGSLVSAKSSVQHSGSFGSSFGALGIKIPYIIISRPKQVQIVNYNQLYGYPAHRAVTIGACSGYLRVREVNVKSSTANDEEKTKIEELLKAGVYV